MKIKAIVTAVSLASLAVLTGCATSFPLGLVYTSVKLPVTVGNGEMRYSKKGEAKCQTMFGCFASGDASINAACKNGGITKVSWVSYSVNNFLGTYATYTTTVYGD